MISVRLERERGARGEFLERSTAVEVARDRNRDRVSGREEIGIPADECGAQDATGPLVPCISASERETELIGQIVGEIAEYRPSLGVDITQRLRIEAG